MLLRKYREEKGMSIAELASKMDVEPCTISRWELRMRNPDIHSLTKLAQILNCSVDNLLGITRENPLSPPAQGEAKSKPVRSKKQDKPKLLKRLRSAFKGSQR